MEAFKERLRGILETIPHLAPLDDDDEFIFGKRRYAINLTDEQWMEVADHLELEAAPHA